MDIRQKLLKKIAALKPAIIETSRFVHSHPEEGYQEKECSRFLATALAKQGFRVEKPLAGLATATGSTRG